MRLLASGRDADVWALDAERVLRRYRDGRDMSREADVMRHAAAHGFPVPAVYGVEPGAMVLERLYGPTMLASLRAGDLDPAPAGAMLGELLVRLGPIPAAPALPGLVPAAPARPGLVPAAPALPGLVPAAPALPGPVPAAPAGGGPVSAAPARRGPVPAGSLLHLDLHPDNVVLTGAGPVVIDWSNATAGPSTLDVAMSALILAEVAVGGLVEVPAAMATDLLAALLGVLGPADPTQLDAAVARRRANPTLSPAEKANLPAAATLVRGLARHDVRP